MADRLNIHVYALCVHHSPIARICISFELCICIPFSLHLPLTNLRSMFTDHLLCICSPHIQYSFTFHVEKYKVPATPPFTKRFLPIDVSPHLTIF